MAIESSDFRFPNPFPKQLVAFIDVLGFSELVYKNQNKELESYFDVVTSIIADMKDTSNNIQSITISDSIILTSPSGLQGFKRMLRAVRTIQRKLLFKNILIRGAISSGEVFFDDKRNIIVGKGYIRAYLLEKEAIYPRVIIDPALMTEMGYDRVGLLKAINGGLEFSHHENYIYNHGTSMTIPNDAIFLDYAYTIAAKDGRISKIISKVYSNIKKNLYSEQKLYAKYNWLRNYYLECIKRSILIVEDRLQKRVLSAWIVKFERL